MKKFLIGLCFCLSLMLIFTGCSINANSLQFTSTTKDVFDFYCYTYLSEYEKTITYAKNNASSLSVNDISNIDNINAMSNAISMQEIAILSTLDYYFSNPNSPTDSTKLGLYEFDISSTKKYSIDVSLLETQTDWKNILSLNGTEIQTLTFTFKKDNKFPNKYVLTYMIEDYTCTADVIYDKLQGSISLTLKTMYTNSTNAKKYINLRKSIMLLNNNINFFKSEYEVKNNAHETTGTLFVLEGYSLPYETKLKYAVESRLSPTYNIEASTKEDLCASLSFESSNIIFYDNSLSVNTEKKLNWTVLNPYRWTIAG